MVANPGNEVKLMEITIDHKLTFTKHKQFMQYSK